MKNNHSLVSTASKLLLIFTLISITSGCASVVKGRHQDVPVSSDPSGADIILNNVIVGTTPADVRMERKRDHLLTIEKKGYAPSSIPVLRSVGGAVWGNIIAGGLIGWGVDAMTGAQYNLKPETVNVRLKPLGLRETAVSANHAELESAIRRLNELDIALTNGEITENEYGEQRVSIVKQYFPDLLEQDPEG
jgi:hypothetical protein